jgi:hypothetical protein
MELSNGAAGVDPDALYPGRFCLQDSVIREFWYFLNERYPGALPDDFHRFYEPFSHTFALRTAVVQGARFSSLANQRVL